VSNVPPRGAHSRRDFVALLGVGASTAWLASIWPGALEDAAAATERTALGESTRYRTLTPQQADDFGAIADRIIPPDDAPGARDAGVVFFADRFLATFSPHRKPAFDKALADVHDAVLQRAPNAASFAALSAADQDEVLRSIEPSESFATLRVITIAGYFSHPRYGGNRDGAAWKAIGMVDRMAWTPPFGYYDRPEVMAQLLPRSKA
jgi:gluconate 2-dehydrogenase gamma chain